MNMKKIFGTYLSWKYSITNNIETENVTLFFFVIRWANWIQSDLGRYPDINTSLCIQIEKYDLNVI